MGWIDINDKYPPQGLQVLLEVSGTFGGGLLADHSFYIGSWIVPQGKTEGNWLIYDNCDSDLGDNHLAYPTVHAWMPLPEHFQPQEIFGEPEDDLMEHAMFEDDPEWLYKGDYKYEQMSLEDFLKGANHEHMDKSE